MSKQRIDPAIIAALIGVLGTICVTLISIYANRMTSLQNRSPTALPTWTPAVPSTPIPTRPTVLPTIISTADISLEDQVVILRQEISSLQVRISDYDGIGQRLDNIAGRLSGLE